jgi:hypothetical protein
MAELRDGLVLRTGWQSTLALIVWELPARDKFNIFAPTSFTGSRL